MVNMHIETTPELVLQSYERMKKNIVIVRAMKPTLTLADKILLGHLEEPETQELDEGESHLFLRPDRVALQDVTGQMTLLQFMQSGLKSVSLPTTVHCDHLIQARVEGESDLRAALTESSEVFAFLQSACQKYGIGFWKPGAGIIHQVVLENYAFPGGLLIGTDSHTPNAGGLGMAAIGVGGADAAEVMAGLPWELLYPKRIGVKLIGEMHAWTSPKDVILYLAGKLTVDGGTNSIIEYFGNTESISCTGKATITNMGAELGATTSIFPYDKRMETYLRVTGRGALADIANKNADLLKADAEVEKNPEKFFHRVIEIDLSKLEPHVVGPHTPDLARPISKLASEVTKKGYLDDISVALIGSCTNSSYEDMSRSASVANQARKKGVVAKSPLLVTPGSEQIRATIERDGQIETLRSIGATVLANACGPCIGQWSRPEIKDGQKNTIVTSYNRNFPARNDGKRETMNFIASPEIVTALALAGKLSFNPLKDYLDSPSGKFILTPPPKAPEVPQKGFASAKDVYVLPSKNPDSIEVRISPSSDRLQKLEPFSPWDGKSFDNVHILLKAAGKCTTDHISPAGPWLKYRGHLDKISDNMFLGAVNAYNKEIGKGKNPLTGSMETFPSMARKLKEAGKKWVVIGDSNYGEGSSREHAAMSPRHLGCAAVITRSFARIHETNLKKQGVLALTFADPKDYDKIREDDKITIDLSNLGPTKPVRCVLFHSDGKKEELVLKHSYSGFQLEWFKAGSALNLMRSRQLEK